MTTWHCRDNIRKSVLSQGHAAHKKRQTTVGSYMNPEAINLFTKILGQKKKKVISLLIDRKALGPEAVTAAGPRPAFTPACCCVEETFKPTVKS